MSKWNWEKQFIKNPNKLISMYNIFDEKTKGHKTKNNYGVKEYIRFDQ